MVLEKNKSCMAYTASRVHYYALSKSAGCSKQHVDCDTCKGTGNLTFNFTEVSEILPCYSCKNGTVTKARHTYNRHLWCACKDKQAVPAIYARDGVLIFGNITKLCSQCGFVRQFS
jgi:hypothetical protein